MVRIVNNEPAQRELTEEAKITLGLLGVVIADHPEKVRKLLRDFGIETREKPTGRELTHKVLYAIDKKGSKFHLELAQLIAEKLPNKGQPAQTGEDGYVDVIAGAVGAIATTIGSISGKKQKQREASQQTLSTMLAYKAQQEQVAAQQAAQAQAHANKMAWLKGVGILVVVGLVGWGLVKMANQQPQAKQALT